MAAGKSIWVHVYDGDVDQWIRGTDPIVRRCGAKGASLWYPEISMRDAEKLLACADKHWGWRKHNKATPHRAPSPWQDAIALHSAWVRPVHGFIVSLRGAVGCVRK